MKKITAEGIPLYYYTATDDLNEKPDDAAPIDGLPHGIEPRMASLIAQSGDMRLILVDASWRTPQFEALVVYDVEGESLITLDEKVRTDTYTDKDFEKLLYTMYHPSWVCRNCRHAYPVLIWGDRVVNPLFARVLWKKTPTEENKVKYPQREFVKLQPTRCPNCNNPMGDVLKIFPAWQIPWPDPWPRRS